MSSNLTKRNGTVAIGPKTGHLNFHEHRTKTHRVHSLESEAEKKKFAQEYAKITTDFKNILGSRKDRLKRAT